MNISFNIKDKKEDPARIILRCRYDGGEMRYSTGVKIPQKYWNGKRAKQMQAYRAHKVVNNRLDNLEAIVEKCYFELLNEGKVSTKKLREKIMEADGLEVEKEMKLTLFQFIEKLIADRLASKAYDKKTCKTYNSSFNYLKGYAKAKKRKIDWDDISLSFLTDFTNYLYSLDHSQSYVWRTVKDLKTFLNAALEDGLTTNRIHRSKRFSVSPGESTKIYLTPEEIEVIYAADFSSHPRLDRVRDIFISAYCQGCRFSDIEKIRTENFKETEGVLLMSYFTTKKVGKKKRTVHVVIPVDDWTKAILEKYNGQLPRIPSSQKMNEYIKEVADYVGINQDVILYESDGPVKYQKHELVTRHTSRHSFITNMLAQGAPESQIMKMTGILSSQTLQKYYLRHSLEENALLAAKKGLFKRSS